MMDDPDARPDVVGAAEIADMLNLSRQQVHNLTGRDDFPPATQLAMGKTWKRLAVRAWQLERELHRRNRDLEISRATVTGTGK